MHNKKLVGFLLFGNAMARRLSLPSHFQIKGERGPTLSLSTYNMFWLSGCNFVVICEYNNANDSLCCLRAVRLIN